MGWIAFQLLTQLAHSTLPMRARSQLFLSDAIKFVATTIDHKL
jgi:hypothetical protein